jgi:hypothetical protein
MMGCPTLLKHNGVTYVAGSRGVDFSWSGTSIEIASTTDGKNISFVSTLDFPSIVSGGSQPQVWTESFFKDSNGDVYLGLLACPNGVTPPYTTYLVKLTSDLTATAGSPVAITGSGLPSGFFNVVFAKIGSTYVMFYKNENGGSYPKYLEVATSSSLLSGYTPLHTGDWAGWGSPVEAPVLRQIGNEWWMWIDYEGAAYKLTKNVSGDPTNTSWSAPATCSATFGTQQHGSTVLNPFGPL